MSNELTPKPRNAMMIKNLCPGLMEMGKIKIGNKGAMRQSQGGASFQAPQKLDHFLITTNERGKDNNFILDESLHKIFGEAPKSVPVRLIYDDISLNFATRYICYYGKTVFCSGDGEEAQRLQKDGTVKTIPCTCGRQDPKYAGDDGAAGPDSVGGKNNKGKCKINGILSVIIDGAQAVGGVWKFRTTSYNSVVGILSSLALIQRITGGRLAGIPMMMTVSPKTVANPLDGKQQTIYVVGLQYAGTMDSLRDTGYQIALTEAKHGISMQRIEEDAMIMLSHTPVAGGGLGDDLDQDVIEEFYPEEAKQPAPALVEALQIAKNTAPPLAAVTVPGPVAVTTDPEVIDIEGEAVDTATGEVIEPVAAPEKEKRTRRTKEQMEADRLAAERPVEGQTGTTTLGAILGMSADDDDSFPDPPGTVEEDLSHPGEATAEAGAAPEADAAPIGDLF